MNIKIEHDSKIVGDHEADESVKASVEQMNGIIGQPMAIITQLACRLIHPDLDCVTLIVHTKEGRVATVGSTRANDTDGVSTEATIRALNEAIALTETRKVKS